MPAALAGLGILALVAAPPLLIHPIGLVLFALLGLSIPGPVGPFLSQAENPVILIVRQRFGDLAADLMLFVAFASIVSCLIANLAVATRMSFALARDSDLPLRIFDMAQPGVLLRILKGEPIGTLVRGRL